MENFDPSSHEEFVEYYEKASQSHETLQRMKSISSCVLRVLQDIGSSSAALKVADIGCGAGTQSLLWAQLGHYVYAVDVNERLLELARNRASSQGYSIDFQLGSAVNLPWPNESFDVCLAPELLEHVSNWRECLNEFARVLRPGGILYLTTTNSLCPVQQEFNLPMYSWYPSAIKRYCERLAVTTRPQLANFAKYPAVNWFTFYQLREVLSAHGFRCMDRFDIVDLSQKGNAARITVWAIRTFPILRVLAHIGTPGTTVVAIKGVILTSPQETTALLS